jgi:hypothetical protein
MAQTLEAVIDRFLFAGETSRGELHQLVARCRELIECRDGSDVERPLCGLSLRFALMQFMMAPHLNDHDLVSQVSSACKTCFERDGRVRYYEAVRPQLIESFVIHSAVRDRDLSSRYPQFATLTDLLFAITPNPASCYMDFVMKLRSGAASKFLFQESRVLAGIAMAAFERSEIRHDQEHREWERCLKEILRHFSDDVSLRPRPASVAWRVCGAFSAFEDEGTSDRFERFMMTHFYSYFVRVIE